MHPEGWERRPLGSVTEFQRGFDLPSSERREGPYPIISSSGHSGYHDEARVKAPGIVTGRYGSIGDVFFVDEDHWPLNTALWVKDFHGNDPRFAYYLLQDFDFKKFADKTGVPGINRNDIHRVPTLVPPLPEQKKIAEILSTWDAAIETTGKLLANAEAQKRALMQQLLTGKRRLNGFEEWRELPLLQVCELVNGRGFKPHEWRTDGYPIIRIQNLNGSDEFNYFDGEFDKKILVKNGQLLFAWSGSRGTSFGPHIWRGQDAVLNYHTWKVLPHKGIDQGFLHYLLRHITAKIEASAHGASALVHTQKWDMERRIVSIPSLSEQQAIAGILSNWDETIEANRKLFTNTKAQKRALMQQLLTGKRRVTV